MLANFHFGNVGETGASCYNFHSKSLVHKKKPARDFFGRDHVMSLVVYNWSDQFVACNLP